MSYRHNFLVFFFWGGGGEGGGGVLGSKMKYSKKFLLRNCLTQVLKNVIRSIVLCSFTNFVQMKVQGSKIAQRQGS